MLNRSLISALALRGLGLLLSSPAIAAPPTQDLTPAPPRNAAPAAVPEKPAAPPQPTKPANSDRQAPATAEPPGSAPSPPEPEATTPDKGHEAETTTKRGEAVQVFGWREWVCIGESSERLIAKLDTGALTSSLHAEDVETFERDGQKWVRFIIADPTKEDSKRIRVSAPLVRTARIKNPGGESESRLVVRLSFKIGERKMRAEFTLNNRSNMTSPVLVGRTALKELGLIDPGRTYLAEEKIMR